MEVTKGEVSTYTNTEYYNVTRLGRRGWACYKGLVDATKGIVRASLLKPIPIYWCGTL